MSNHFLCNQSPDEYKSDSSVGEDDADEFTLPGSGATPSSSRHRENREKEKPRTKPVQPQVQITPTSKILKGLSVSFGKVSNPEQLKMLVKQHGGSVIEYVTKSVTHVVCSEDKESIMASTSKIQSAAAKQVPAVTEKLIYDSIEAGRILPERNYLVSKHSYQSRVSNNNS